MAERHDSTAKKSAFLKAFPEIGTVRGACKQTGIDRSTHYTWIKSDPEYAAAFETAKEEFTERLEQRVHELAYDGWEEPVFHEGEPCGHKWKFSPALQIFLLKANRPEKYRDNIRHEHSGPDGRGIPLSFVDDLTAAVDQAVADGHTIEGTG